MGNNADHDDAQIEGGDHLVRRPRKDSTGKPFLIVDQLPSYWIQHAETPSCYTGRHVSSGHLHMRLTFIAAAAQRHSKVSKVQHNVWTVMQSADSAISTRGLLYRSIIVTINSGLWTAVLALLDLLLVTFIPIFMQFGHSICPFSSNRCSLALTSYTASLNFPWAPFTLSLYCPTWTLVVTFGVERLNGTNIFRLSPNFKKAHQAMSARAMSAVEGSHMSSPTSQLPKATHLRPVPALSGHRNHRR